MTLSQEQYDSLLSNYAESLVDGMDMDTLMTLAHDLLMDSYSSCSEEEIRDEILDLYDDEVLQEMVESVTDSN